MTPKSQYASVQRRVKAWRYNNRLGLRRAARQIGMNFSSLYEFERGRKIVNAITFLKLAAFVEKNK